MTLIDSDKLWDEVHTIGGCGAKPDTWEKGWDDAVDTVIKLIENAPEVDNAPTSAHWEHIENGRRFVCSACGTKYMNCGLCEVMLAGESIWNYEEPRYCPHCGAHMDEGVDDNENC